MYVYIYIYIMVYYNGGTVVSRLLASLGSLAVDM